MSNKAVYVLAVIVGLLFGAMVAVLLLFTPQTVNSQPGKSFSSVTITESYIVAPRPVYPYSLLPGGVRSVAELRKAFKDNPEYAAMFPGFDFTKAHLVHIKQWAWVNFRKDGKVGWSKEPILLDEDIVSDGRYMIRLRCANKISSTPQVPVDPSVVNENLGTPMPPAEVPPSVPEITVQPVEQPTISPVYAGGSPISGLGTPPLFIYIPPSGGGPPPIAVPEPSEWALAFLALNAILFTQFFKKRRK